MARFIRVAFTYPQLKALAYALSNTVEEPANFEGKELAARERPMRAAQAKIIDALAKAEGPAVDRQSLETEAKTYRAATTQAAEPAMTNPYRVYCDGREFGLGYATLALARIAKRRFAAAWPRHRYYIRKVRP